MRFSNPEKLKQLVFDPEKKKPYTLEDVELQTIPCSYEKSGEICDADSSGDEKLLSDIIRTENNHGAHFHQRLSVSGNLDSEKNAPFICLEPWYGHADFSKGGGRLPIVRNDDLSPGKNIYNHIQFIRYFKKTGYAKACFLSRILDRRKALCISFFMLRQQRFHAVMKTYRLF